MELKVPTDSLSSYDKLQIKDTQQIEGKKLLALFLAEYSLLERLLADREEMKAIEELHNVMLNCGVDFKLIEKAQYLPCLVCASFCDFIAESPHVHVTID